MTSKARAKSFLRRPEARAFGLVAALSLLAHLFYLAATPPALRSYDFADHLDYIRLVASGVWPAYADCHLCLHPPLYYFFASLLYRLLPAEAHFFLAVRLASLVFYAGFAALAARELRSLGALFAGKAAAHARVAIAALVFVVCAWPSGFLHATRLSNDALSFFLVFAAFTRAAAFYREPRPAHLYAGALLTAAAFAVKSSALLLVPVWGMLGGARLLRLPNSQRRRFAVPAAFFACVLALCLADVYPRVTTFTYGMNSQLGVRNTWPHLLGFDLAVFLGEPYTSSWSDVGGRQFFWNYLWKTSLFGEFAYPGGLRAAAAGLLSALLLFLLLGGVVGIAHGRLWKKRECVPHLLFFAGAIGFIFLYRVRWGMSSTGDFRFAFAAMPSLVLLLGAAWSHWIRELGARAFFTGLALLGGFALASGIFFATL